MSISKKFTVALVAILVSGIFVSALSIYFIERDHIASRAIGESERISRDSLRLLGVIDSIMAERVKSSMAALRQLGGNIGQPRQGERVRVNDREVPNLYLGDSPIANDVVLVDKLTIDDGWYSNHLFKRRCGFRSHSNKRDDTYRKGNRYGACSSRGSYQANPTRQAVLRIGGYSG